MGRSITPKYAVYMTGSTPFGWNSKQAGRPTDANLEKFVKGYAKSLEAGGVNEHVSKALGHIPYPTHAEIRRNVAGGGVVARWQAAKFQVWN